MNRSLVLGHRGAPLRAAENTVDAFLAAIDEGADGVELDVQLTCDGVLVLHHDTVVGGVPVWQTTYETLCSAVGHRLSTLPEVFAALPPSATIFVEFKRQGSVVENDAHRLISAAVRQRPGFPTHVDKTIVGSFDPWFVPAVAAVAPDLHRGLILERRMLASPERFDATPWGDLRWVSFDRELLNTQLAETLVEQGFRTLTWSVNDEAELAACATRFPAVGGVITKHPGLAARIRG